jgi:hypothetical protein
MYGQKLPRSSESSPETKQQSNKQLNHNLHHHHHHHHIKPKTQKPKIVKLN